MNGRVQHLVVLQRLSLDRQLAGGRAEQYGGRRAPNDFADGLRLRVRGRERRQAGGIQVVDAPRDCSRENLRWRTRPFDGPRHDEGRADRQRGSRRRACAWRLLRIASTEPDGT